MKSLLGVMLSGWLLALSLLPDNAEWLGWFAAAPLGVAVGGRGPLEAMVFGHWDVRRRGEGNFYLTHDVI